MMPNRHIATIVEHLLALWDPLDLLSLGAPADEYRTYTELIVREIEKGTDSKRLAALLARIRSEYFNQDPAEYAAKDRHLAQLLALCAVT